MKAEERHRLHENELQRLAEHARERTRPFFDRYGTTLLLGLAAALVVAAVVVWFVRSRDTGSTVGWSELIAVFRKPDATAEDFANVAELYPGSQAAVWAKLYEGEARLSSGLESLFTDKEGAVRDLTDARTAFEAVLDNTELESEVEVRALYGLARTLETTSDGDLAPAIERYEQIVSQFPGTVYEGLAKKRLEALKSADAKAFYAWFSKQEPAPRDTLPRPSDSGFPAGLTIPGLDGPSLFGETPATDAPASPAETGSPTDAAPATPAEPSSPTEAPRPAAPAEATEAAPMPTDSPSATEAPADGTPAAETVAPPAESSTPADPAPADPAPANQPE